MKPPGFNTSCTLDIDGGLFVKPKTAAAPGDPPSGWREMEVVAAPLLVRRAHPHKTHGGWWTAHDAEVPSAAVLNTVSHAGGPPPDHGSAPSSRSSNTSTSANSDGSINTNINGSSASGQHNSVQPDDMLKMSQPQIDKADDQVSR